METTYKLNAQELTPSFIASIQNAYLDRDIEIIVREAETSPVSKAIENIEQGKNIVFFESLEQAIQCAEEQAAR